MSDFLLKFLGVLIGWVCVVIIAYLTVRWCFDYEMSGRKVALWATWTFAGILSSIAMYYLFPQRIQDIFNVAFDHLICGVALTILLLRVDDYLIRKFGHGMSRLKLYGSIFMVYGLMILDAVMVIQLNSHVIVNISDMVIAYLTRAGILFCLALEIKLRNQSKHEPSVSNYDMEDY